MEVPGRKQGHLTEGMMANVIGKAAFGSQTQNGQVLAGCLQQWSSMNLCVEVFDFLLFMGWFFFYCNVF